MSDNNSEFIYQLNGYFGIHYNHKFIDAVLDVAGRDARFAGLNSDSAMARIDKFHLFASTNSDEEDRATRGLIFVDEMTIGGPDVDEPEDGFLALEPAEMEKREKRCEKAVNAITDLYELIVRDFKAKKISLGGIHLGWMVLACTWDSDDSSSDDQPTKTQDKKATKK